MCPPEDTCQCSNLQCVWRGSGGEVVRLGEVTRVGLYDSMSVLKEEQEIRTLSVSVMWGHTEKGADCKPGTGPSPSSPWPWTSQPPELRE